MNSTSKFLRYNIGSTFCSWKRYSSHGKDGSSKTTKTTLENYKWMITYAGLGLAGLGFGAVFSQNLFNLGSNDDESNIDIHDPRGPVTEKVYMDVSIGGGPAQRLVIGLYGSDCPITVKNFVEICRGETKSIRTGKLLSYKGVKFHRIIPKFMCQSGDITQNNGYGGESIYGKPFADENFKYKHVSSNVISMANSGPNSNSSQFFISTKATPWLDNKHVVFGHVLYGGKTIKDMEDVGTSSGHPKKDVVIVDCGLLPPLTKALEVDANEIDPKTGRAMGRIMT
eukprot:gene14344-30527_t